MSITVKLAISLCLAVLLSLGKEVRMAVYNVIPARFTNLDIRDTLNANGGSVGDNSSDYFGVRANVNIFSLKKPVKFNKQFVTDADAWWKADNGNFGIILPPTGSLPAVGSPMSPWSWDFPGGSGSPLRISDYAGYNPKAPHLFSMHPDPGLYPNSQFRCSILLRQNAEISINNIADISRAYMGVVVRHQANGELRFRTLNRSVMEMQQQEYAVVLDAPNWPDGKVDVYMVASYAEASEQSYSSINVTLFSMNQGPLETAYMVKTLAKPVPNSFKFDYKVVNDFANEYHLECTFTSIKGAWEKARFSVFLESDPIGAFLGGMGESLSPAPIGEMLSQGESYTFNSQSFTRVQTSQNNYVNYTARYLGDNYQSGSIFFRAK